MGYYYWPCRNKEDYKGILWTMICQQIKQDSVDKFLERHRLPNLIQKEIKYYITNKNYFFKKKKPPPKKSASPDRFTGEFYKALKE